jgi:hypothetical protein
MDRIELRIAAVGDTNGYDILPGAELDAPLKGIRGLTAGDDVFIFNSEGIFSENLPDGVCRGFPRQSLFRASPDVLDLLPAGRFRVASLANNHILDCGREGLIKTMQEMKKRGILTLGAGEDLSEACGPLRVKVNGMHLTILSYLDMESDRFYASDDTAGAASWTRCDGQKQIAGAREDGEIILVFLHIHHGSSWIGRSYPSAVSMVKDILAAGADIVIATGPHVPQGILKADGGLAILSLGNFLFQQDRPMPEEAYHSVLADLNISEESMRLFLTPLRLNAAGIPEVAAHEDALQIIWEILSLSRTLGTEVELRGDRVYLEVKRRSRGGDR